MIPAPTLEKRLADQLQIHRLAADYCWGLDLADRSRFLSIWAGDATWNLPGMVSAAGLDEIAASFDGLDGQYRSMHHLTTDLVVDWHDDGTASGLVHGLGASTAPDGTQYLAITRYTDRYALHGGRWLLASRTATLFPLASPAR